MGKWKEKSIFFSVQTINKMYSTNKNDNKLKKIWTDI